MIQGSQPEPGQEAWSPHTTNWQGWLLVVSPWGSQEEAGISWVGARVSAKEPEVSP